MNALPFARQAARYQGAATSTARTTALGAATRRQAPGSRATTR